MNLLRQIKPRYLPPPQNHLCMKFANRCLWQWIMTLIFLKPQNWSTRKFLRSGHQDDFDNKVFAMEPSILAWLPWQGVKSWEQVGSKIVLFPYQSLWFQQKNSPFSRAKTGAGVKIPGNSGTLQFTVTSGGLAPVVYSSAKWSDNLSLRLRISCTETDDHFKSALPQQKPVE